MLNVLIIGCGNIAGNIDYKSDINMPPRSHAKAYAKHPNFNLIACIDPNKESLEKFKNYWKVQHGFLSIQEFIEKKIPIDIISICTPTKYHLEILNKVLELKPKLVFCEKPLHSNYQEAKQIVEKYQKSSTSLLINYSRRFDKSFHFFKDEIICNKSARLRSVVCHYNKGALNNASHFLDILIYLLDNLTVKWVGKPIYDHFKNDPTFPITLESNNGIPIFFVPGNSNDYSIGDLDFIFSNGRTRVVKSGVDWIEQTVTKSIIFRGYNELSEEKVSSGDYINVFTNAIENIHDHIYKNQALLCSGKEALKVVKIYEDIMCFNKT